MNKRLHNLESLRTHLKKQLKQIEDQLGASKLQSTRLRAERSQVQKALRAVEEPQSQHAGGRVAPTLRHVRNAYPLAFQGESSLPEEQLSRRLIQILKAEDSLSEQGLTLRVQQGISRLPKDSAGLVLAPTGAAKNEDRPSVS